MKFSEEILKKMYDAGQAKSHFTAIYWIADTGKLCTIT